MTKWILRIKIVDGDEDLKELYKNQIEKHVDMMKHNNFPDSGFDVYCK